VANAGEPMCEALVEALHAFDVEDAWHGLADDQRSAVLEWLAETSDEPERRARVVAQRLDVGRPVDRANLGRHWASWQHASRISAVAPVEAEGRMVAAAASSDPLQAELQAHAVAQRTWEELSEEETSRLRAYAERPRSSHGRRLRAREVRQALTLGVDGARRWLTFFSSADALRVFEQAEWGPFEPAGLPGPRVRDKPTSTPPPEVHDPAVGTPTGIRVELQRDLDRDPKPRWLVLLLNIFFAGFGAGDPPEYIYSARVVTGRFSRVLYASDWTYLYDNARKEADELTQLVSEHEASEIEALLRTRRAHRA
jgi:hypothetical protein